MFFIKILEVTILSLFPYFFFEFVLEYLFFPSVTGKYVCYFSVYITVSYFVMRINKERSPDKNENNILHTNYKLLYTRVSSEVS